MLNEDEQDAAIRRISAVIVQPQGNMLKRKRMYTEEDEIADDETDRAKMKIT